jgi:phage-related baseplate assembly protein
MAELTVAELVAQIEALKASNAALTARKVRPMTLKVSAKGAVSIYGLNSRFPVTLYSEQVERVLDAADTIRTFIAANRAALKTKE